MLAERYRGGTADDKVFVYAAGGYYYPGKNVAALQDEIRKYLDLGYTVVKMKIGGESLADDLARIEAAIAIVGTGKNLAVDANGRFDLKTAIELCARAGNPTACFGRSPAIRSILRCRPSLRPIMTRADGDRRESVLDAGCAQSDPLRRHAARPRLAAIRLRCRTASSSICARSRCSNNMPWSPRRCIPHGGHQMSLNIAAVLGLGGNESYPDVFQPFGGFADDPPVENSYVKMPEVPGIGFEAKAKLYAVMKNLAAG